MDKILQQIEEAFAPQLMEAQEAFNLAQQDLMTLNAQKEEKMRAVREYYEAVEKKAQAEVVIANTDESIKSIK